MRRPLYDQLVNYYEVLEGRDWRSEIDLINSVLSNYGCRHVIDLGCGTGYHVRALTKLGFEITGIDTSMPIVRVARKRAAKEGIAPRFVVGSYYAFSSEKSYDAALCLNWSIPCRNDEVRRFLDNTSSLLRLGGLLIFDYEKTSEIVWDDLGNPIMESWNLDSELVVRVSVGQVASGVLSSRDAYLIYQRRGMPGVPNETSRYAAVRGNKDVQMYVDHSSVRFFSLSEIKKFARLSGFRLIGNHVLPRKKYKRNYAILEKTG